MHKSCCCTEKDQSPEAMKPTDFGGGVSKHSMILALHMSPCAQMLQSTAVASNEGQGVVLVPCRSSF